MSSDLTLSNSYTSKWALVLDDHSLFAETFSSFLEKTDLFKNIRSFTNTEALKAFLINLTVKPDIYLFLDFYLKDKTSLHFINELRRLYKSIYIIIISSVSNPVLMKEILNYDIQGFLSKYSTSEELIDCVKHVSRANPIFISQHIMSMIAEYDNENTVPFSAREIEILGYFAKGLSVIDTAEAMILSRHTIVSHRRRMMAKTNTNSITELLAFARKIDLI